MVDAYELYPSIEAGQSAVEEEHLSELSGPMIEVYEPAVVTSKASYQLFRKESIIATILIVLIGSAATYFASGYVLKPITTLSQEIKKRNVSNFSEALPVPSSSDEIQELTVSFNQLLSEVQHSFQLQKQFSADAAHELRTLNGFSTRRTLLHFPIIRGIIPLYLKGVFGYVWWYHLTKDCRDPCK